MNIKIKEGFRGERMISLSEQTLESYSKNNYISNLYVRKIGFFPKVKYHFIEKENGCDYSMLIYCTEGRGWYKIYGRTYYLIKNQFIILPAFTPYSFGADKDEPWTIYWIHFRGKLSSSFYLPNLSPKNIVISEKSRLQDRFNLFEEIFSCFSMAHIKEFMLYSSSCLHLFLSSLLYLEQYRYVNCGSLKEFQFSNKVIKYMEENIHHTLTLEEISSYFKYSPSHFSMLFQKETNISPINYFIRLKIQKACLYIETTNLKMNEISQKLGFEEPAYFSRLFKKAMGISPSEYKKKETL